MRITLGTQPGRLETARTERAARLILGRYPEAEIEIRTVVPAGSARARTPLERMQAQEGITKTVESALLDGRIDLAVYGVEGLPAESGPRLCVACVLKREDARDALVLREGYRDLESLPDGTKVGAQGWRRGCQLAGMRAGLRVRPAPGTAEALLEKVASGSLGGVILSSADLRLLGFSERITQYFPVDRMIPACGQGALVLQARSDRADITGLLAPLNDRDTSVAVTAERVYMASIGGTDHFPVGVYGSIQDGLLTLRGLYGAVGGTHVTGFITGEMGDSPEKVARLAGARLARELREKLARKRKKEEEQRERASAPEGAPERAPLTELK